MQQLEANDYRNAVALINRASIQGNESEYVATLKARLLKHAEVLDKLDAQSGMDTPHKPTLAEIREIESGN